MPGEGLPLQKKLLVLIVLVVAQSAGNAAALLVLCCPVYTCQHKTWNYSPSEPLLGCLRLLTLFSFWKEGSKGTIFVSLVGWVCLLFGVLFFGFFFDSCNIAQTWFAVTFSIFLICQVLPRRNGAKTLAKLQIHSCDETPTGCPACCTRKVVRLHPGKYKV